MKVLLIAQNLRPANGVASFVMNYYRKINKRTVHIDFALFSWRESPYYDEIANDSEIIVLPPVKDIVKHIIQCYRIIKEGNYDVVHCCAFGKAIPIMFIAKMQRIKVRIMHSHNSVVGEKPKQIRRNRIIFPLLISSANCYLACSQLAGKNTLKGKRFTVLPNVISSDRFIYSEDARLATRGEENQEKHIVGFVGRISHQKNPFFIVDFMEIICKQDKMAICWMIGDGPLNEEVKKYIENKGLVEKVILLGTRTDLPELYSAMDVFILPSVFEGLGYTAVEAQAMGLPCFVTDEAPIEVSYTDLVTFLPVNEGCEIWAKEILKVIYYKRDEDRKKYNSILRDSVYSDKLAGNNIEKLYKSFLEGST